MVGRGVLGQQWERAVGPETLAEQAARVARNNARTRQPFSAVTARELRREKARADADTD